MTLPELALRFILANTDVSVVIPGMRKSDHVRANIAAGDGFALGPPLLSQLRTHRWDRDGAEWYEEAQA
jgi:aryl-alcohol dehydrogenase-like predicted oxidoreductase